LLRQYIDCRGLVSREIIFSAPGSNSSLIKPDIALDLYMWAIYYLCMKTEYPECAEFDWDEGNRDKNLKHAVQNWECEQIFFNEPLVVLDDPKHSIAEDRLAAFGRTDNGRMLVVIYTMRNQKIRVISARDMNKKERQFYENTIQD